MESMLKTALQFLIKIYAWAISPLTGPNCRFHPTCSVYAHQAIEHHGALKGSVLAIKRLIHCHPYYKGPMIDEVPPSIDWTGIIGYKRGIQNKAQKQERHN